MQTWHVRFFPCFHHRARQRLACQRPAAHWPKQRRPAGRSGSFQGGDPPMKLPYDWGFIHIQLYQLWLRVPSGDQGFDSKPFAAFLTWGFPIKNIYIYIVNIMPQMIWGSTINGDIATGNTAVLSAKKWPGGTQEKPQTESRQVGKPWFQCLETRVSWNLFDEDTWIARVKSGHCTRNTAYLGNCSFGKSGQLVKWHW